MLEQILEFIKQYKKNKSAVVGFIIVVMLLLTAIFAPLIAPYLPDNQRFGKQTHSPYVGCKRHWWAYFGYG